MTGDGTPEADWASVLEALPRADAVGARPDGRVVVVAPHPDDETLGVGGLLATWSAYGAPVTVVAVTDGEGSHPEGSTLTPRELAARRADERADALAALGLGDAEVLRLGLPDGGVRTDAVAAGLAGVLRPDDLCLHPVEDDGHPDHEATAAGVARAGTGAARAAYGVWVWHRQRPGELTRAGARALVLPAWARERKAAALACFPTQTAALSPDPRDAAVLPPAVLAHFGRDVEVLWSR